MSLYKDASLVMIPSAYKDGKLYSIRPTDGSGDFTFSRGSNLAATRVDVNGLIEKGRENLLTYSNDFSQGVWNKDSGASVSSGEVGYDGSNDAWRLNKGSLEGPRLRYNISLSSVHTGSIYVKAGTLDYFRVDLFSGTRVCFDLVNGEVVFSENEVDATITSAGNGWWKISVTRASSIIYYMIYPANSDATFGGTGTDAGYVYIQDAQLEAGLVATDYIETGASTAQAGILEDMPRLDYSGGASCPALLLEPQRTNKITNSEYINTTTFNYSNLVTINNNYSTSPDGLDNAAKIIADASSGYHQLRTSLATASGYDMVSCFVKASGYNYVQLASWANPANYVNFDLTDGSVGSIGSTPPTNYGIEDYGNGWYRIYANVQASGGGIIGIGIVTSASAGWAQSFTGNGTDGLLIWGVQIEAGSYPTSYIPTYGSSVTRSLDFATKTGLTSSINSTQGTMFLDFKALANNLPSEYSYFSMSDGTYSNRISILQSIGGTNQVRAFAFVGGTKVFDLNDSVTDITAQTKVVVRYANNAFDLFVNGAKVATDTSGSIFSADTLDRVSFSEIGTTTSAFKGQVNQTAIFPTALTDSECIALTSI